jgi:hypothetical protein
MKGFNLILVLLALLGVMPLLGAAAKTTPKETVPAGTVESGLVTVDQLSKLQTLQFVIKGPNDDASKAVLVRTILPHDWTEEEKGTKKGTNELDPKAGVFTMLAKPPTTDNQTDFVYQLDVLTRNLTEGLDKLVDKKGQPIQLAAKDRTPEKMFTLYLNSMIGEMLKRKYKSTTRQAEIKLSAYGIIPEQKTGKIMLMGSRPAPMFFVPINFTHPETGETIYTFTGSVGEKIVSLRFFVAKDKYEDYASTISLIVNNTWGLTLAQEAEWKKEKAAQQAAAKKEAAKQKAAKPKTKQ